ncbi:hypothetical protein BHE74_00039588 [Ensete ventricosum]|nr:hypothetical protein BHE74_00039588 [Ensete ventricosum]
MPERALASGPHRKREVVKAGRSLTPRSRAGWIASTAREYAPHPSPPGSALRCAFLYSRPFTSKWLVSLRSLCFLLSQAKAQNKSTMGESNVRNDVETIGSMQVDLVTETDKACEELIFNHLKKHYPDHKVYLMFPFVCVSIGLAIGKVPTVGVVYNPIVGEVSVYWSSWTRCFPQWESYKRSDLLFFHVYVRSGGDFDLMSCRVAASNCHLKDAFILALTETE